MPTYVRGIAGPIYSHEELAVAALTPDGKHVQAWVTTPPGEVWTPEGGDLIWLPPSATKSTDVDGIGQVIDVVGDPEVQAFVTAQLAVHAKYLDYLRDRIRRGLYKVSAAFRRQLGMLDEDGAELAPRTGTGTLAYKSIDAGRLVVDARRLVADGRRMAGLPIDRDTGLADPGATEARIRDVSQAAAKRYAETGDASAAMAELRAALARTRTVVSEGSRLR